MKAIKHRNFRGMLAVVGAALGLAFTPGAAQAHVTFFTSPGGVQPEENVLLDTGTSGSTVFGTTNQSNAEVEISSTIDTLSLPSQGQARVEAADGGVNQLCFRLVDGNLRFREFEFNAFDGLQSGSITIKLAGNIDPGEDEVTFNIDDNGQNYFGILASGDQYITEVCLDIPDGVQDVRQIRIGGVGIRGGGDLVPEPTSLALFAGGLPLLGLVLRRRRR